jgi:hypothetical protein
MEDREQEIEAKALEEAARSAERSHDFDLAAKFYRRAAEKYDLSSSGSSGARCRSIAETIDD